MFYQRHDRLMLVLIISLLCAQQLAFSAEEQPESSQAESYPEKTVRIICPWSPGGGTDRVSRFWAGALEEALGQPFVVVNRTGGSGAIGHFAGAHAAPDGHTIAMITFELSTMHRMNISKLTYRNYECLLQMNADPAAIIVNKDAPWQTLQEFLDAVRKAPGKIKMSGTATGGAWDLARAGMLQAEEIPIDSCIWVPHPGAAPSLVELMGGHLDAICCSVPEVAAHLANGEVRVLAVMSDERMEGFPDLLTAREQGVDWVAVGWRGLALPKGTPPAVVNKLKSTCLKIANSKEFAEFMGKNGFGVKIRATEEFREFLVTQDEQWKSVVEAAGYDKGVPTKGDPGPSALPWFLFAGIAVAIGFETIRGKVRIPAPEPSESGEGARDGATNRVVVLSLGMVAYVVAVQWLGFHISTWLFVTITAHQLGARWWAAAVAGALLVAIISLLFVFVFEVQLPPGIFWGGR